VLLSFVRKWKHAYYRPDLSRRSRRTPVLVRRIASHRELAAIRPGSTHEGRYLVWLDRLVYMAKFKCSIDTFESWLDTDARLK
jgi:hypothetical protein